MTSEHLPSYESPPVAEVVLAVAFNNSVPSPYLGAFWETHLRAEFPTVEEQPPYEPPPRPGVHEVSISMLPPPSRIWARSVDSTRLVQLQRDWMAFNWQDAAGTGVEYPRWPKIEESFLDVYDKLVEFLGPLTGPLQPRSCEVTYINHIPISSNWAGPHEADKVLTMLGPLSSFPGPPVAIQLSEWFRITDADVDRGLLQVTAQTANRRTDNAPVIVLTLVARGDLPLPTRDAAVSFLRLGHEWIVRSFDSITTPAMHEEWERLDD